MLEYLENAVLGSKVALKWIVFSSSSVLTTLFDIQVLGYSVFSFQNRSIGDKLNLPQSVRLTINVFYLVVRHIGNIYNTCWCWVFKGNTKWRMFSVSDISVLNVEDGHPQICGNIVCTSVI
jgi:hypothetical protein